MKIRLSFSIISLFLGSSCWLSSAEVDQKVAVLGSQTGDTGATDTGSSARSPCSITKVEPQFHSNGSEQEVEISVVLSGENLSVMVGQKQGDIVAVESGVIRVQTPLTKRTGWSPITVETEVERCTVAQGINFFEHGEGLIGAYGFIEWHEFQGDYWVDNSPFGSAEFRFVRPLDVDFGDAFGRALDSCESAYVPDVAIEFDEYHPEAPAQLDGPSGSLAFPWDVKSSRYVGNLAVGDFSFSASYTLKPIFAEADWPRFELPAFVETPNEIRITNPNVDEAVAPELEGRDIDLRWSNASGGDYVVARIGRYVDDVRVEEVRCLLEDDGAHSVNQNVWDDWVVTDGQYLIIELGRVRESKAVLPYDLSQSGVVGVHWSHGAVYTK